MARFLCWALAFLGLASASQVNKTYTNPILPGFNPDPSCTFVAEWNNTVFCSTSSFLTFPGAPIWASKDFVNWKLASHVVTREEQLPELHRNSRNNEGIWACSIRYRDGIFYLITSYVSWFDGWGPVILLYTTDDPYGEWSNAVELENPNLEIDPDLFWDTDGQAYMGVARGIFIHPVDLETHEVEEAFTVWNGTGERNPEGPNLYIKDDYYYMIIGEGGTESNHSTVIARADNVRGPYEGWENNPLVTAKDTDNFFQTVGHSEFFQDAAGNWWMVCLATRSGPDWEIYPMGREMVLAPMTWPEDEWPIVDQIFGEMEGPLPEENLDIPGDGHWADQGDSVDFEPGSKLPSTMLYWRIPKKSLFEVSPEDHPNTLKISPSRVNLTADAKFDNKEEGMGLIFRKQSASIFNFTVDVDFKPTEKDEEAGVTAFLTQSQHIDLGIVNLPACDGKKLRPKLRFRVESHGRPDLENPGYKIVSIPPWWTEAGPIRLSITSTEDWEYVLSAAPADKPEKQITMGVASAGIVSGGDGPFHGTLIGAYATRNGGNGTTPAYFSRWRYDNLQQEVALGEFIEV